MFGVRLLSFLLLLSGSLFSAHATTHANTCAQLLLEENFEVHNAALFLDAAAKSVANVEFELPYHFTKGYSARLLRLKGNVAGADSVYLSHTQGVQVVPVKVHVESWHNMIMRLDGFHFTLGFQSMAARDAFVKSVGYKVQVFEGKITVEGKTEYVAVLTPEQLTGVLEKESAREEKADGKYVRSGRGELEMLSDSNYRTENGTTYYFKGRTPIGFARKRKYYKYVPTGSLSSEVVNFASHANILKRQRGSETVPLTPEEQFRIGRENLEETLAKLDATSQQKAEEREMSKARRESNVASVMVALQTVNYPWKTSLPSLISQVAYAHMEGFAAQLRALPQGAENVELAVPDLHRVSNDVVGLKSGTPNSTRFVRFIWLKDVELVGKSYLRQPQFSYVDGAVLHDQMVLLSYGSVMGKYKEFTRNYLRGGLVRLTYDGNGKASKVELVDSKMTLPEAGRIEMTQAETEALQSQLNGILLM